jgi:hypothetical protein
MTCYYYFRDDDIFHQKTQPMLINMGWEVYYLFQILILLKA